MAGGGMRRSRVPAPAAKSAKLLPALGGGGAIDRAASDANADRRARTVRTRCFISCAGRNAGHGLCLAAVLELRGRDRLERLRIAAHARALWRAQNKSATRFDLGAVAYAFRLYRL